MPDPLPFDVTVPDPGVGAALTTLSGQATTAQSTALGYLSALQSVMSEFTPPSIHVNWSTPDTPLLETPDGLTLTDPAFSEPNAPGDFTGSITYTPAALTPPAPPIVTDPSRPIYTAPIKPVAPKLPDIRLPSYKPTPLPAPPTSIRVEVPKYVKKDLPDFTDDAPIITLVPPQVRTYTPGEGYTSALLSTVLDGLTKRLTEGGRGINPDVERAIWERAVERERLAARQAVSELDRMEQLGFSLPPGAYVDARLKISLESNARMAGASREIAIKQAELELENVKAAYQTATELEARLLDSANQIEQRAFDYARYVTEANVQSYNAQVQAYGVMLEGYKARVAAYEARIRTHLADVEVFKTEVQAESAKVQINQMLVDEYKARIQASLAYVDVYKAEVDATRVEAEINKLRVDVFGAEIEAYSRTINAYTAELDGYKAAVSAEASKVQAYSASVAAYDSSVRAEASKATTAVEVYKARLQAKVTEWEAYKARVEAEAQRVRGVVEQNRSLVSAHEAELSAVAEYNKALIAQWSAAVEEYKAGEAIAIEAQKVNAQNIMATQTLVSDAVRTSGQVAAQLTAAAYSAVNYSMSYSGANSGTKSDSISENTNISV